MFLSLLANQKLMTASSSSYLPFVIVNKCKWNVHSETINSRSKCFCLYVKFLCKRMKWMIVCVCVCVVCVFVYVISATKHTKPVGWFGITNFSVTGHVIRVSAQNIPHFIFLVHFGKHWQQQKKHISIQCSCIPSFSIDSFILPHIWVESKILTLNPKWILDGCLLCQYGKQKTHTLTQTHNPTLSL